MEIKTGKEIAEATETKIGSEFCRSLFNKAMEEYEKYTVVPAALEAAKLAGHDPASFTDAEKQTVKKYEDATAGHKEMERMYKRIWGQPEHYFVEQLVKFADTFQKNAIFPARSVVPKKVVGKQHDLSY